MKRSVLALCLCLISPAAWPAERPSVKSPTSVPRPERRDFTLANGLPVTLIPFGDVPKVSVLLVFRSGNVDDPEGHVWLADVTGELLEQGTEKLDATMMARLMAGWGGQMVVNVGPDTITIGGTVLGEHTPALVGLIADLVEHPRFPAEDLPRIKAGLIRQLNIQLSTPGAIAGAKLAAVMYPKQPYGKYFPKEAELASYTLAEAREFFDKNLHAGRAHLYISGKFDGAAVEKTIRDTLTDWRAGPPAPKRAVKPVSSRVIYFVDRPGAVQSTLRLAIPVTQPSHADYAGLKVMDQLLGGAFVSRITSNIREQKGYTYAPFSTVTNRDGDSYWVQSADVTAKDTGAALKEIQKEIDRLRAETPGAEEVAGIERGIVGVHLIQLGSRDGVLRWEQFIDFYGLPQGFELVKQVLAVGPPDVQSIARKYLDPKRITIVVIGDAKTVLPQLRGIAKVIK